MSIAHPPTPGTAHWIVASPRAGSFNERLFRDGVATLGERYTVLTSDLRAQRFNPVLADDDLGEVAARDGNISVLAGDAYTEGTLAADIVAEHEKVAAAELIVIQFPLWWFGMPAVLKGWFDRVLTAGFSHGDLDPELGIPRRYGDGGLVGRRALIIVTAGDDASSLGPRGIDGDLDALLFPLTHGTLWYTGIESLDLHLIANADDLDEAGVTRESKRLSERLRGIDNEIPRLFRRLRDGEYDGTRALRSDIAPGRTDLDVHLSDR